MEPQNLEALLIAFCIIGGGIVAFFMILSLLAEGVVAIFSWVFGSPGRPKTPEVKVILVAVKRENFTVIADETEEKNGLWLNMSDHRNSIQLTMDWDQWREIRRAVRKVDKKRGQHS